MNDLINHLTNHIKKFVFRKPITEDINGSKVGDHSSDTSESLCCRICNARGDTHQLLYNPCSCVGQSSHIHRKCLAVWFQRARYDVLCCECKARYVRIKYRQNSSFTNWLQEEPSVRRHVLIGAFMFPLLFAMIIFGGIKAMLSDTGNIFKVLFVPTMAFGVLTIWKFVGSLALIIRGYNVWKTSKINTKCDENHKTDKKD